MTKKVLAAGVVLALLSSAPALAVDGFAVEGARGEGIDRAGLALQWDWGRALWQGSDWQIGGFWEASFSYWHKNDVAPGQNDSLADLGFTPVFRFQPNSRVGPYLEAGIGLHLQSRSHIADKNMSTLFQFGDHIGFGYRFGARNAFDLGYRFQHHSNAGIKRPNPGINFHEIRLTYHFQ